MVQKLIFRFFVSLFAFLIVLFVVPSPSFAHTGGGPPFVTVNGAYSPNDLYYQGVSAINIPQDQAPSTYLPKRSVSFAVDLDRLQGQLSILPSFVHKLTFRWSFYQGTNFTEQIGGYQYGQTTSYTFSKPRTYLVLIDAKAPTDPDYITIDAVQVNIVPFAGYRLPKATIAIGSDDFTKTNPILFISDTKFDPSVSRPRFLWDFADEKIQQGQRIEHTFSDMTPLSISYVYTRVIDDNGLMDDVGFNVENVNDKVKFVPFGNMNSVPIRVGTRQQVEEKVAAPSPLPGWVLGSFLLGGLLVGTAAGFVGYTFYRKKR